MYGKEDKKIQTNAVGGSFKGKVDMKGRKGGTFRKGEEDGKRPEGEQDMKLTEQET